jgi:uncharacterized lipoprotein YbaY
MGKHTQYFNSDEFYPRAQTMSESRVQDLGECLFVFTRRMNSNQVNETLQAEGRAISDGQFLWILDEEKHVVKEG